MTTKNYLNRAYNLERVIKNKTKELETLKTIALKTTSTFSDVPPSGTRNVHRHEDIMVKIVDLEDEIRNDTINSHNAKKETMNLINKVDNIVLRMLLEERYICCNSWEIIAIHLNYSVQHIYRLHSKALKLIEKILKDESR